MKHVNWTDAACLPIIDLDFASIRRSPKLITRAQAVCADCPVRNECAELGEGMLYGVWGGIAVAHPTTKPRVRPRAMVMPSRSGGRPRTPIVHGTTSGYQKHLSRGEEPCEACAAAGSEYNRDYRLRRAGNTGARYHQTVELGAEPNTAQTASGPCPDDDCKESHMPGLSPMVHAPSTLTQAGRT